MVGLHNNIPSKLRWRGCVALLNEIGKTINGVKGIEEVDEEDEMIWGGIVSVLIIQSILRQTMSDTNGFRNTRA